MQDDTVKETTMADEALADVPMPRGREFNKFSLVHRVYYACRDGFSRLLLATLKDIDCEHDRKAIVDQVSDLLVPVFGLWRVFSSSALLWRNLDDDDDQLCSRFAFILANS
ncbi:sex-determining protein fem-1 [Culex quinquefasciatus]|uniref:Sex-determining protein fem-1 n=1 Tax=Culex quinquefasciatus TaxID=7176 RepID=B0WUD8_CULQU|nr:sex-determining protein fem-1 [Culex quinquefasciatus]|eukprot:XP_001858469.1 sex-determining protein fem-1 [Culex quinquefasciatus]